MTKPNPKQHFRHEGRKLKQELRCHAVLCPSASKARFMAERLKERLHQALVDFKKEKVWRQNARLSLANSTYDNPTMPYRKVLNSVSGNYRPPIERGKAAPKLKIIEEVIIEEDESIHEDSSEAQEGITNAGVHTMINERSVDGTSEDPISGASRFSLNDSSTLTSRLNEDQLSCSTLLNEDSDVNYKRLSVCSDNISVVTTETTVILEPDMSIDPQPTTKTPHQTIPTPEGNLIDVSNDPRPRPKPAPRHSLTKASNGSSSTTNNTSICGINIENGCDPGTGNCGSSDEEEDEDVVTNYLDKMSIKPGDDLGIDNLQVRTNSYSSRSPDSHQFSTKSDSSIVGENDEIEDEDTCENGQKTNGINNRSISGLAHNGMVETNISSSKVNDQDTISDESGYSEESNAVSTINGPLSSSTSPEVGVKVIDRSIVGKNVNGANNNTPSNILSSNISIKETSISISQENDERASYDIKNAEKDKQEDILNTSNESTGSIQDDPTVHGVLISDFSASDRLKYLDRSRQSMSESKLPTTVTPPPDFFQNKIQEFVINI